MAAGRRHHPQDGVRSRDALGGWEGGRVAEGEDAPEHVDDPVAVATRRRGGAEDDVVRLVGPAQRGGVAEVVDVAPRGDDPVALEVGGGNDVDAAREVEVEGVVAGAAEEIGERRVAIVQAGQCHGLAVVAGVNLRVAGGIGENGSLKRAVAAA